jgi:nicotinamide-nucleotide amidase
VTRPVNERGPGDRILILVVGDEILDGSVPDRNGSRVAAAVSARGGIVSRIESVGDDAGRIAWAVEAGVKEGGVIVAGGIGPTADDVTREAVAAALGRELVADANWAERLAVRHPRAARLPGTERQSRLPDGARPIDNPGGTALGFVVDAGDSGFVLVLPGVPSELAAMLDGDAGRFLDERLPGSAGPSLRVAIAGVPESVVASRLQDVAELRGVRVASYPQRGTVDLVLRVDRSSESSQDAAALLERGAEGLRRRFGPDLYEVGRRGLAEVVLAELRSRGARLAVAESCTGGGLGATVTSVPGSSEVFWGGTIVYSNDAKREMLDVPESVLRRDGAVSEAAAVAMARGMRERSGSDWAVAITGIAGPGGGSPEKPVGTVWIAVEGERGAVRRYRLPGGRQEVRDRSVAAALDLLRRCVLFPD